MQPPSQNLIKQRQFMREQAMREETRLVEDDRRRKQDEYMKALAMAQDLADQSIAEGEAAGAPNLQDFSQKRLTDILAALGQQVPVFAQNRDAFLMAAGIPSRVSARKQARAKAIYDKIATPNATPEEIAQWRKDTRPLFDGMTFSDVENLLRPEDRWYGSTARQTPVNSLEAALARAIEAGDEKKAARIRREIAAGKAPAVEPGTWSDTGRVDAQGRAILLNNKTGETRSASYGAKPDEKAQYELANKRRMLVEAANETLKVVDEILTPEGELKPEILPAVGKSRYLGTQYVAGTDAYNAEKTIARLRARLVTDLIQEMKTQSRTGATGFGQLSDKERLLLQDAAAKLDPGQSEEVFRDEMKRIRERILKLMQEPTTPAKKGATKDPLGIL